MELRFELPDSDEAEPADDGVVLPFDRAKTPACSTAVPEVPVTRQVAVAVRSTLRHQGIRFRAGFRSAVVGDGVLGMRPRPVADLIRQFWTAPPPYIRDALALRIPYAAYGAPVIAVTAAAHALLLVISYPSVLAGACVLVLFISLFI